MGAIFEFNALLFYPSSAASQARRRTLIVAAACVGFALIDGAQRAALPAVPEARVASWPAGAQQVQAKHLVIAERGTIPMPADTPAAHASSLLAMPASSSAALMAFWFAGERESAPNVQVAASWLERATGRWQAARFVINKEALGAQLGHGVRRLGNPVAWLDAQGQVHVFVVATGLGGWAAGRVAHLKQRPGTSAATLELDAVRVLPLSWLFNTSHLVRTAPLALEGGGALLPLYFELGIKYAVVARLGPQGEFLGLERVSAHDGWLQPSLAMRSPTDWLAFMRDHSAERKVAAARSQDAGRTWQDLPPLALDNPDASVAALGLGAGLMLMAHNPSTTGREALRLSTSADGLQWAPLVNLAVAPKPAEFSYPALAWADGSLWVSYTEERKRIAWVRLKEGKP